VHHVVDAKSPAVGYRSIRLGEQPDDGSTHDGRVLSIFGDVTV
jgi:hypothetical protein